MRAWIKAEIKRGGFASERFYTVDGIGGSRATGLANKQYVLDEGWGELPEPAQYATTHGLLECRILVVNNAIAFVELPCPPEAGHGERIKVWLSQLVNRPNELTTRPIGEAKGGK